MASLASRAVTRLEKFAVHDLANLLWSYPSLELEVESVFFARVHDIVTHHIPTACAGVLSRLSGSPISRHDLAQLSEFTNTLLELAWSFSFIGRETAEAAHVLRSSLMRVAKVLDEGCSWQALFSMPSQGGSPSSRNTTCSGRGPELPHVVFDLNSMVAVLKPPQWEVDARVSEESIPVRRRCRSPLFSGFLRWKFPRDTCPLMHCSEQQYGIIHRLDAPSSGLILVGKNFVGYYALRWQQDTYELGREYMVFCHGCIASGSQVINAKIKTQKTFPAHSMVSDKGRPAWTQVQPSCTFSRVGRMEECYSFVVITIRTGRTHQIRVHLEHIGHPTVTDGKYTGRLVYSSVRV